MKSYLNYRHQFVTLLVTYRNDFLSATRLVDSFLKNNLDATPMYILVPEEDEPLFSNLATTTIFVIPINYEKDDFFFGKQFYVTEDKWIISPGYLNQQITKLLFGLKGYAHSYLSIDSDFLFTRPFTTNDFIPDAKKLYYVGSEERELLLDDEYYHSQYLDREKALNRIKDFLGIRQTLFSVHGGQLIYSDVIKSLFAEILAKGFNFKEMLLLSPYEYNWYTYYIQTKFTDIVRRDPFFFTIHSRKQMGHFLFTEKSIDSLKRSFYGVVLNSNINGKNGELVELTSSLATIANYLGLRKLIVTTFSGSCARLRDKIQSIYRHRY